MSSGNWKNCRDRIYGEMERLKRHDFEKENNMKKLEGYGFRKGIIISGIFLISAMICAGLMFPIKAGAECVSAIAGGGNHTAILKTDGTVWTCGKNNYGQLGDGTATDRHFPVQVTGLTGVRAIAAGESFTIVLKSDGTVWAWGYNAYGMLGDGTTTNRTTPVQVSGLTGVNAVAVGDAHSVALKSDGTVWTWGWNGYGGLGEMIK
jgi:alpha-tubulin suppressor-like RCC1 family protein